MAGWSRYLSTGHCEPLVESIEQLQALCARLDTLQKHADGHMLNCEQVSPSLISRKVLGPCKTYLWHRLDLRPSLDAIEERFHRIVLSGGFVTQSDKDSCMSRRSDSLLQSFYDLIVRMRSRKHLPPQPFSWFQRLVASMGKNVCIRVAFKEINEVAES